MGTGFCALSQDICRCNDCDAHTPRPVPAPVAYSFFSIAITLFNKVRRMRSHCSCLVVLACSSVWRESFVADYRAAYWCAVAIHVLQALLTTYGFDSTITLTFLQGCVTVVCLQFMKWRGIVTFPDMSWKLAKQVLPLSFVFVSYVVISLMSLGRVNVPMFTALRRLQILFTVVAEYLHFGNLPSRAIWNSIIIMTLGAAIAAWKDLTFDPVRCCPSLILAATCKALLRARSLYAVNLFPDGSSAVAIRVVMIPVAPTLACSLCRSHTCSSLAPTCSRRCIRCTSTW